MSTVLFINHRIGDCGVYQFGRRVYELVSQSTDVNYLYREAESEEEYKLILKQLNPEHIIYNWHRGTMPWLSENLVMKNKSAKKFFIFHEEFMRTHYDYYLFFGDYDLGKRVPKEKSFLLPRPLLEYKMGYPKNDTFTIGSFGFPFKQKGLHSIVSLVNSTFDKAVINFHIPKAYFSDPKGIHSRRIIKECRKLNTNRNVKLNISTTFLDTDTVLEFLAGNDINVFMYTENGEGISSVIDYALSVKRPIAITRCQMFRHIIKDEITLDKNSIIDIANRGTKPLEEFYEKWSIENFKKEMDGIFLNV